jgi:hypothetical protein
MQIDIEASDNAASMFKLSQLVFAKQITSLEMNEISTTDMSFIVSCFLLLLIEIVMLLHASK